MAASYAKTVQISEQFFAEVYAMCDPNSVLDAKQKAAVRWLAEHLAENRGIFDRDDVISATGLSAGQYAGLLKYLKLADCIHDIQENLDGAESFILNDAVSAEVHKLDNPPPRNYSKEWLEWFHSRPWSIFVVIGFLGIPAIVTWIQMIKTVLGWFGIGHAEE